MEIVPIFITTFGTSGKFIRASSSGSGVAQCRQASPSRSASAPLPVGRDDPAPTPNATYRATRSTPLALPRADLRPWGCPRPAPQRAPPEQVRAAPGRPSRRSQPRRQPRRGRGRRARAGQCYHRRRTCQLTADAPLAIFALVEAVRLSAVLAATALDVAPACTVSSCHTCSKPLRSLAIRVSKTVGRG